MIKETFCKIIELPEEQVLVEKSNEGEESAPFLLIFTSLVQKIKFRVTLTYDIKKDRDKNFDKFDEKRAKMLVGDFKDSNS